jgi:hypothetical protein
MTEKAQRGVAAQSLTDIGTDVAARASPGLAVLRLGLRSIDSEKVSRLRSRPRAHLVGVEKAGGSGAFVPPKH